MNNKDIEKRGLKLEDGVLHEADHVEYSRRRFLKSFGLAGGLGFMLGGLPVSASTLTRWSMPPILEKSDRILIMIRLKGGMTASIQSYHWISYRLITMQGHQ